jgi:glycerol-3-phosphate dehydrogenase
MWIYESITGVKREERHSLLNKMETKKKEPSLTRNDLIAGMLFFEYRTDDSRLTIEVMKAAVHAGATAINYLKATSFIYKDNKIVGADLQDMLNSETHKINATYVVNAGGPWVDEIDDLEQKRSKHKLQITKGIHLVVNWDQLPVKQSVYFDTPDKRMLFVIPRDGKTYMGTTDTFYNGDLIDPDITSQDRDYVLTCVANYFPNYKLIPENIESGWAGLRPLVNKPGKGPSEISRKDEIFEFDSGLITIAGGKLTGYRKMAERIVDIVARRICATTGKKIGKCTTDHIQLPGGMINAGSNFLEFKKDRVALGMQLGLTEMEAGIIVDRYGAKVDEIYKIMETCVNNISKIPSPLLAQLIYCIENEMCVSPSDFFIRRTSLLYFNIGTVKKEMEVLIAQMQKIMDWNSELNQLFRKELQHALDKIEEIRK